MKNEKLLIVLFLTIIFLIGCSSREYDSNMELGKELLDDHNYLEAYEAFELAYLDKETEEVKELMKLSKLLYNGLEMVEQEQFEEAQLHLNEAMKFATSTTEGQELTAKAELLNVNLEEDKANVHEETSKKQTEERDSQLTISEAEKLVKSSINIENYPYLQVQYDHDNEKGHYTFKYLSLLKIMSMDIQQQWAGTV